MDGCGPQHMRGKSTTPRTGIAKATSVDVLHRRLSRTRRPASGSWFWGDDFTFLGWEEVPQGDRGEDGRVV